MQKILLVTDAWVPQVNGVVTVVQNTKEQLEKRGYTVVLIEPTQFFSFALPFYKEIRLAVATTWALRKIIRNSNPDYIHLMTEGPLGIVARRACLQLGLPFSSSYHTNFDRYADTYIAKLSHLVIPLLRRFHNAAEITMVATPSLESLLRERGFKNLAVVPLGVDTDLFVANDKSDREFKKPVFTLFGRLAKDKNPEEFFSLKLPGTKLVIGDGPERAALEARHGGEATFVGFKKNDELIRLLSQTDVLIFTSPNETFGLTIVEAMACGVPVAAHHVMGPRDIITNGVDGVLDENLEKAAIACLALDRTRPRQKALQYSWDASTALFLNHLVPTHPHQK